MCLTVKTSIKSNKLTQEVYDMAKNECIKPTEKTMKCYKILEKITNRKTGKVQYKTPYTGTKFKVNGDGKNKAKGGLKVLYSHTALDFYANGSVSLKINDGMFHAFKHYKDAVDEAGIMNRDDGTFKYKYIQLKEGESYMDYDTEYVVAECSIPVGTMYSEGIFYRFISISDYKHEYESCAATQMNVKKIC